MIDKPMRQQASWQTRLDLSSGVQVFMQALMRSPLHHDSANTTHVVACMDQTETTRSAQKSSYLSGTIRMNESIVASGQVHGRKQSRPYQTHPKLGLHKLRLSSPPFSYVIVVSPAPRPTTARRSIANRNETTVTVKGTSWQGKAKTRVRSLV